MMTTLNLGHYVDSWKFIEQKLNVVASLHTGPGSKYI